MKRRRLFLVAAGLLLAGWAGDALAGRSLAQAAAARWGQTLLRVGQGKIADPAVFLHRRGGEALGLATLALVWAAGHAGLDRWTRVRPGRARWAWAAQAVAGFVGLNVWLGAAAHTALFWGLMGAGAGFQNLMQFHFKRLLLEETPAPRHAVLVGSSQTRAQIDEEVLNELLGTNLWTTELHFPGSHGYDLLLIARQLRRARPQFIVVYLSEGYFYNGSSGETVPNFFGFRDLPDYLRRGAWRYLPGEEVFYGLLGDLLPLFRVREVLAQRLLGAATVQLKQRQYDAALEAALETRARRFAPGYRRNAESEFQKRAFADFVARCGRAGSQVVVLVGQFNPLLARHLDPAVRADLLAFLDQLKGRHPNLVLVPDSDLPPQTVADYEDLSHVNRAAQRRFTTALADRLAQLLAKPPGGR